MPIGYPSSFDALTNPTAADKTNSTSVPHADQHANTNDILEALEHRVGIHSTGSSGGGSSYPTEIGQTLRATSTNGHTGWGHFAPVVLSRNVLGSSAASVDFVSIPQTFAALEVTIWGKADVSTSFVQVEAQLSTSASTAAAPDTGGNYIWQQFFVTAAANSGAGQDGSTSMFLGHIPGSSFASTGVVGQVNARFESYAASKAWFRSCKSLCCLQRSSGSSGMLDESASAVWKNAGPIRQIRLLQNQGQFAAGTEFTLIGHPSAST